MTSATVLNAFTGTFERPSTPLHYKVGLALAALAMVLLPVIYLAVIAAVGWLVYLQATRGLFFGSGIWALIIYLTPIVAGLIVIFFMVKPLLARPVRTPEPKALSPDDEPLLHRFVERICDLVGSPRPAEIRVDCQVNASASFRKGLSSLASKELVLTIGLPLAAGLRADQFAGVLAHEFGHFSQGAGMRLSYLVRTISGWFHRVVFERDEWDVRLEQWAQDTDWRVAIALHSARLGVWIGRKILYGLMMAGLGVSSFLLRQMEFDADLYETRLSGSKTFVETSLEIELLGIALSQALGQIANLWNEGRLVNDIPDLTAAVRAEFAEDTRMRLQSALEKVNTGFFDTHPATKDRIAAAKQESTAGIFRSQTPSSQLFSNFGQLCRSVTENYYQAYWGLENDPSKLIDVEAVMEHRRSELQAWKTSEQVTGGLVRFSKPVRLPAPRTANLEEALAESGSARSELELAAGALRVEIEKFDQAWERRFHLNSADALLRAGFTINPKDFAVAQSSFDAVDEAIRVADSQLASFNPFLESARSKVERRLAAAGDLALIAGQSKAEEWARLRTALNALAGAAVPLQQLQRDAAGLSIILANCAGRENDENLLTPLNNIGASAQAKLDRALTMLGATPYPFETTRGPVTLVDYLTHGSAGSIFEVGSMVSNRAVELYFKILGRLSTLAAEVEKSMAATAGDGAE